MGMCHASPLHVEQDNKKNTEKVWQMYYHKCIYLTHNHIITRSYSEFPYILVI